MTRDELLLIFTTASWCEPSENWFTAYDYTTLEALIQACPTDLWIDWVLDAVKEALDEPGTPTTEEIDYVQRKAMSAYFDGADLSTEPSRAERESARKAVYIEHIELITKALVSCYDYFVLCEEVTKYVLTQEDVTWWHPAFKDEDKRGGEPTVRVKMGAMIGKTTRGYGITGRYFVSVCDADDTCRAVRDVSIDKARALYTNVRDNIIVAQLRAWGFQDE